MPGRPSSPGVTVPLALLGTAAMMYVLNYSLDNLSLMALTIAVGFVVDDAIVMLENVYRHIEAGLSPLEATLKGAGEIGFTIMSISVSLVAVFIPLLLMGGIIGRLFREFAITMTMTIAVSAFVALTLSPTMCALFLRDEKHARHGRAYMAIERAFDRLLAGYTRGLDFVLDHQRATLVVFLITVAATVLLYVEIPKGFFPQQDTGIIAGLSDGPQDISFDEMVRRQHALLDVVAAGPGRRQLRHGPRRQPADQQRLCGDRTQAARSAQLQRRRGHHSAAAAARQGAGCDAVPAGGTGSERRRPNHAHAISIHPAGFGHRRAQ